MSHYKFRNEVTDLIRKVLRQSATEEEKIFLEKYYDFFEKEENILEQLDKDTKHKLERQMYSRLQKRTAGSIVRYRMLQSRIFWAAAIFIALLTGSLVFFADYNSKAPAGETAQQIGPAISKATLLLADGTTLLLDSNNNMHTSVQNGVNLSVQNGHLSYQGSASKAAFNTIKTSKGGLFSLTLADGTRVWLNTESSLQYPIAFRGNEREVRLTGEAYFEVAKNKEKPFKVLIEGKGRLTVLGTHFNIAAYPDKQSFQATLLEGRVKISPMKGNTADEQSAKELVPGEQADVGLGNIHINRDIDMDAVMAWKTGKFYFEDARLEDILTEFSRWYDIDIIYQCPAEVKSRRFFMIIERNAPLPEVLRALNTTDIRLIVEGKRLTVK